MDISGFSVTITPEMMTWGGLIVAFVQMLKGTPYIERYTAWFPYLVLALAITISFIEGWPNALAAGAALGFTLLGTYKAANTVQAARAKKNGNGGTVAP